MTTWLEVTTKKITTELPNSSSRLDALPIATLRPQTLSSALTAPMAPVAAGAAVLSVQSRGRCPVWVWLITERGTFNAGLRKPVFGYGRFPM
jgi:hypothetical protein